MGKTTKRMKKERDDFLATLRDIMTTDVDYVTPKDNVYEVAVKMKEDNVGMIPVLEHDTLIGVITDRDLVVDGIAEKRPGSTRVTDVMQHTLITANPEMSEEEAARLMSENQVRRLPVLENGKLVGIVSLGDLALSHKGNDTAGDALEEISKDTN